MDFIKVVIKAFHANAGWYSGNDFKLINISIFDFSFGDKVVMLFGLQVAKFELCLFIDPLG